MDYFFENALKRFKNIFIGVLCLAVGLYMVISNNYNEVSIVIISVVAFVYAIFNKNS